MRTKCFKSNHALEILTKLNNERRDENSFCDVAVSAGEKDFAGHKCILGAFSSLFSKMFKSEMREKYENKGKVQGVNGETLELVLDFIYTGDISITSENVYNLLEAVDYIEIPYLKRFCEEFLLEDLDESNCLSIRIFAELYNLTHLNENAKRIIANNFGRVIRQEEFYELKIEDISELLQTESRTKSSEELSFQAMIGWIKHDITEREKNLANLFMLVNLERLSLDFIRDNVIQEETIKHSLKCTNMCLQSILSRNLVEKSSAHVVGQDRVDQGLIGFDGKHAYKYDFHLKKVSNLPNPVLNHDVGSAVLHKRSIFVLGDITSKVERMNLNDQESGWTQLTPVSSKILGSSSCCWNDFIYNYSGGSDMRAGQCYNIHQNRWSDAPEMSKGRYGLALVNWENILHAIGGYGRNGSMSDVEFMDPREGIWRTLLPMKFARGGLASVVLNGKIYAIGGTNEMENLSIVECFDPVNQTWNTVAELKKKRHYLRACVVDEKIYVAGGGTTAVETYQARQNKWDAALFIKEFESIKHFLFTES